MTRMLKQLSVLALLSISLTGCVDAGIQLNRLYGLDCRPEVVKANGGYCGATAKKTD